MLMLAYLLAVAPAGWALGLGEIELDSALNEKLDAEIDLLNADGLQPTEIIVSLASSEDFERVGVERFFFLTDLRFEVQFDGTGLQNVQVTSTQPVTEPYLNFLVEVLWPNGRLLKEYTLLLDPPTFSPAPAPMVSAPARNQADETGTGRVERPAAASVSRGDRVQLAPGRQQQPSPLDEGIVDGAYRMTDRSDTLWTIAMRTRPSAAVSVQQNMLAIQRLNPQAFLHDNINLLKAGYALRLPTEQQALSLGSTEANQQVAMQNEDWRALSRGESVPDRSAERVAAGGAQAETNLQAQVDATPTADRSASRAPARDGELRIVAGEGDGTSGSNAVGAEELNAALEEQDRLGREVAALTEELDREKEIASDQIAVKDRQLEVKDQQIAEMQAEMARLRDEMQRLQAAAAEQSQNQSASAEAWWQSPYVLVVAAGVVVLLLVYGLIAARRRRQEEDDFYAGASDETVIAERAAPALAGAMPADAFAEDETLREAPEAEAESRFGADRAKPARSTRRTDTAQSAQSPALVEETGSETGDVIGEADIYIAYGRYPQAIGLLLGVLEEDPDRNDVRLKLLELYAETRDREAFDTHMAELIERCDDDEALLTARELGAEFGDDAAGAPAAGSAAAGTADDLLDGDVALEELTAAGAAGAGGLEPGEPVRGVVARDAGESLGAEDFELEIDDLASDAGAGRTAVGHAGDALGGDLGIDFDPEREQNGSSAGAHDGEQADRLASAPDLDLDLDLDDADVLGDDAFDFDDGGDTAGTKLDLARAYIDMGDQDGARDILNEVVAEGTPEQQQRAQAMLEEL